MGSFSPVPTLRAPDPFRRGQRADDGPDVRNRARGAQTQAMRQRASHPAGVDLDLVGVAAWRRRRLERAGFEPGLAGALAADPRTDVHALLELVDHGCPPALAARILAPLDGRDDGPR